MDAEYRAILEGRNDLLLRKVRWTKELIKGLVSQGLITRDCMKKMEVFRYTL
jgi:hypothetical protein